ncbi:MAG: hypothetical protein KBT48_00365, partial [Firmicutes bacterium]|nr:hypothetical protein [Bacillota bacterium]
LDGTATITVTPKRAKEILKGKLEYMKNRVQEIIDNDDNEITGLSYNENTFDDFEITTNHKEMTSEEKTLVDSLMDNIEIVNQLKGNKNYNYHIVVKNAETGKVLSESSSKSSRFSFNW